MVAISTRLNGSSLSQKLRCFSGCGEAAVPAVVVGSLIARSKCPYSPDAGTRHHSVVLLGHKAGRPRELDAEEAGQGKGGFKAVLSAGSNPPQCFFVVEVAATAPLPAAFLLAAASPQLVGSAAQSPQVGPWHF